MSAYYKGYRSPLSDSFEGLESPFLDQELFAGQGEEEWEPRFGALETESPFLQSFEHRRPSLLGPEDLEARFEQEYERYDEALIPDRKQSEVPDSGVSPVAVASLKVWPESAKRPLKWQGRVYGLVVHTSGSGVPTRAAEQGISPTAWAIRYYKNSRGCHYVNGWGGIEGADLVQIADEEIQVWGVGVSVPTDRRIDQRRSISEGRFEKDLPPVLVRLWRNRWPGYKDSLQLLPGTKTANECYVHVECIPCVYYGSRGLTTGATPLHTKSKLRFTKEQHDAVARLAVDIAHRNAWPSSEAWWRTSRLLGHEDLTPIARHDSKGGWDPGYLREEPYFDWDYVYSAIDALLQGTTSASAGTVDHPLSRMLSILGSAAQRFMYLIASGNELRAVALAHQQGVANENDLTNLVFHSRHKELGRRRIRADEQGLAREWLKIRNELVRPFLQAAPSQETSIWFDEALQAEAELAEPYLGEREAEDQEDLLEESLIEYGSEAESWESLTDLDDSREALYEQEWAFHNLEEEEDWSTGEDISAASEEYAGTHRSVGIAEGDEEEVETIFEQGPRWELEQEESDRELFDSEQTADVPATISEFAVSLGREWSRRRSGQPSAEQLTDWLVTDYRETLEGARRRWKHKYNQGDRTVEAIGRAWMLSRQENMKFQLSSPSSVKMLQNFNPPTNRVQLVSTKLVEGSDKAPIAPIAVRFVQELRERYRGTHRATTYRGHGGGTFLDRGYSVDLFLDRRDSRGFYAPEDALKFLRALNDTAQAINVEWRVIYNDFSIADTINRETGQHHVIFVGKAMKKGNNEVTGLVWHGPNPLILHMHLDLVPRSTNQPTTASFPSASSSTSMSTPGAPALKSQAELVSFAQRVLNSSEGERLVVDGDLGPLTRGALERFRTKYNLGRDGVLDEKTQLALVQRVLEELRQQSLFPQLGVLDATTRQEIGIFKSRRGLGTDATLDKLTRAALADALGQRAVNSRNVMSTAKPQLDKIVQVAAQSAIARYRWRDRGVAPPGYIKGMALVYARVYCKFKAGDLAALEMAKANTGNAEKDALAHYAQEFRAAGLDNSVGGVDTLRHLFVLLIGLGMRESGGNHCTGRDRKATNTSAETAEAGLFQTSYNARHAHPAMQQLFTEYLANPSGFKDIFREGVRCTQVNLENFGTGNGKEFQRLSKECPAFAAEFAAVGLRNLRKHWGPINRRGAEIRPECDAMLLQVQKVVDEYGLCPLVR